MELSEEAGYLLLFLITVLLFFFLLTNTGISTGEAAGTASETVTVI